MVTISGKKSNKDRETSLFSPIPVPRLQWLSSSNEPVSPTRVFHCDQEKDSKQDGHNSNKNSTTSCEPHQAHSQEVDSSRKNSRDKQEQQGKQDKGSKNSKNSRKRKDANSTGTLSPSDFNILCLKGRCSTGTPPKDPDNEEQTVASTLIVEAKQGEEAVDDYQHLLEPTGDKHEDMVNKAYYKGLQQQHQEPTSDSVEDWTDAGANDDTTVLMEEENSKEDDIVDDALMNDDYDRGDDGNEESDGYEESDDGDGDILSTCSKRACRRAKCIHCGQYLDSCFEVIFGTYCMLAAIGVIDMGQADVDWPGREILRRDYVNAFRMSCHFMVWMKSSLFDRRYDFMPPRCMLQGSYKEMLNLYSNVRRIRRYQDSVQDSVVLDFMEHGEHSLADGLPDISL